jgi:glycosyltransferase involved in cell wall biosynthesis
MRIAVLIPCYNEAVAIPQVVGDFRAALPDAEIWVFDNNSRDGTAQIAASQGALVKHMGLQGKGHVVRRQFADVEADIYIMVDGDDTYHAASAQQMVRCLVEGGHDMVVGVRKAVDAQAAYRAGHVLGNRMLTGFLSWLFGSNCTDILTGYRVFSRRFVKSFPVLSTGFDIETELTVHALEMKMSVGEVETPYKERPEGSFSKLSTYKDGFRILRTMLRLFSAERPLAFFGSIGLVLALASLALIVPLVPVYMKTGLVPRLPTASLATGVMLTGLLCTMVGLVLDTVTRGRREAKMLAYLRYSGPR